MLVQIAHTKLRPMQQLTLQPQWPDPLSRKDSLMLRTQFQLAPLDLNTPHFYEVAAFASEDHLVHSKTATSHALPV